MNFDFNPISFDFNYLTEKKHIGEQDYFKTKIKLKAEIMDYLLLRQNVI